MSENTIQHNETESRFELDLDGELAHVDYELDEDVMIITHTFVPPALRGEGVAARVVKEALEYARSKHLKVIPQCGYVEVFLQRNPEYRDLRDD